MNLKNAEKSRIGNEAYALYKSDVASYNLNTFSQVSLVGMIGGVLLAIVSLPPFKLLSLFEGYLSIAVLFSLAFVLTRTVLKKHESAILPVYYGFITLMLCLALVMGTYLGRDTNATTFVMLIMVLPMFIIDVPYRLNLLFGIMSVAFCLVDWHTKSGQMRALDIGNCIVFYMLSVVVSRQSIRAKMSDIIIKHELKQQRDMDMLTKLSNRGAFERVVAQYIHQSNKNAIMLIMDIDNFKAVNDTMGHAYGDMVLQLVSEYLRETFRRGDIVSRLGGDEFVAFLPYAENISIISEKVQSLIDRVRGIVIESEVPCTVGASVGIAQYPEDGCSFEELYKRADTALYLAKKRGKGQYAVYDAADNA